MSETKPMSRYELAQRLRALRQKTGWSQVTLAIHLGVSHGTISNLEHGRAVKELDRSTVERLAALLEVPVEQLLPLFPTAMAQEPAETAPAQSPEELRLLLLFRSIPFEKRAYVFQVFSDFLRGLQKA